MSCVVGRGGGVGDDGCAGEDAVGLAWLLGSVEVDGQPYEGSGDVVGFGAG